MRNAGHQAWERWLDRELKQLPDLPAPAALVHQVMLAVHHRRSLPWFRRPWPAWPPLCQIISLMLFATLAGMVMAAAIHPAWLPGWDSLSLHLERWTELSRSVLATATAFLEGLWLVLKTVGRHIFLFGALLALVGYLAGVAILTTCYRLAVQPR